MREERRELWQEPGGEAADCRVPWEELMREESLVRALQVDVGFGLVGAMEEGCRRTTETGTSARRKC